MKKSTVTIDNLSKLNEKQLLLFLAHIVNETKPHLPSRVAIKAIVALFDEFLIDRSKVTKTKITTLKKKLHMLRHADSVEMAEYLLITMDVIVHPEDLSKGDILSELAVSIDMATYLSQNIICHSIGSQLEKTRYKAFEEIKDLDRSMIKWLTEGK